MASEPPVERVFVLGHTGFIGSHLVSHLEGHGFKIEGASKPRRDLTEPENVEAIAETFDERTAVVMLAAVKRKVGDTLDAFEENVRMATNLARAVEDQPVGRFVFFSSAAVYGEDVPNRAITEDTPVDPRSYYGIAKYTSERIFRKAFADVDVTSLTVLRPPHIYGPGDRGGNYGPSGFLEMAHDGETITLWGDGSELREFIYVGDAVEVVHRLLSRDHEGVLNLASGTSNSFRDVVDVARKLVDRSVEVDSRERTRRKVDNAFENDRLRKVLPDVDFHSLEEGMRETYEALRGAPSIEEAGP